MIGPKKRGLLTEIYPRIAVLVKANTSLKELVMFLSLLGTY